MVLIIPCLKLITGFQFKYFLALFMSGKITSGSSDLKATFPKSGFPLLIFFCIILRFKRIIEYRKETNASKI